MSADLIIVLLVIFILILAGLLLFYFSTLPSVSSVPKSQEVEETSTTDFESVPRTLTCPVNECAVNIKTGYKRCPAANAHMVFDPKTEVCSTATGCSNSLLPYAVQTDGSVRFDGRCPNNSICPCVKFPQCPDYIVSAFNTKNGNPYSSIAGQRLNFPQFSFYNDPNSNLYTNQLPIVYNNISSTFCAIPINWITLATPGCPATVGAPTVDDIVTCMNLPRLQSGNACLNGVLAFLPENANSFDGSQAINTPVGCVRGNSVQCQIGEANVWDNQLGQLTCKRL